MITRSSTRSETATVAIPDNSESCSCAPNSTATWDFPKIGVPYFGVLRIRIILLFRVLYLGPIFSETPTSAYPEHTKQVGLPRQADDLHF